MENIDDWLPLFRKQLDDQLRLAALAARDNPPYLAGHLMQIESIVDTFRDVVAKDRCAAQIIAARAAVASAQSAESIAIAEMKHLEGKA